MKKLVIILAFVFMLDTLSAQDSETKTYPKHEIGFSVGAFPTIGALMSPDDFILPFSGEPIFGHTDLIEEDNGNYEKMYHFGSYTFNYNYHFNSKHSIGVSLSWVGKHIDTYWEYSDDDIVNGSGWKHFFTLQLNYRKNYFHKDKISLYWGIYHGLTLCVRDKNIIPSKTHYYFLGSTSNARYYFGYALHIDAFGIEIGEKYVFHAELGIGTQGLLKTGFKYKF